MSLLKKKISFFENLNRIWNSRSSEEVFELMQMPSTDHYEPPIEISRPRLHCFGNMVGVFHIQLLCKCSRHESCGYLYWFLLLQ